MLSIPRAPETVSLVVDALWNAQTCLNRLIRAKVDLSTSGDGLRVSVAMPRRVNEQIPNSPIGSRVEGLWNYDVVELFLRGQGDHYLEMELGAGGHYLALEFNGVRQRINDFADRIIPVQYQKYADQWTSEIVIPWNMIPDSVYSLNAYVIASGEFLAYAPVPGLEPNFHQLEAFAPCQIEK